MEANARLCRAISLGDFNEFDIALEQVVDQGADVDALGFGACAEIVRNDEDTPRIRSPAIRDFRTPAVGASGVVRAAHRTVGGFGLVLSGGRLR